MNDQNNDLASFRQELGAKYELVWRVYEIEFDTSGKWARGAAIGPRLSGTHVAILDWGLGLELVSTSCRRPPNEQCPRHQHNPRTIVKFLHINVLMLV